MKAKKIEYSIIDPAGNFTALVTTYVPQKNHGIVARKIMDKNPCVEQVGFVRFESGEIKLNMSGGEFCGNATMSAAALYYHLSGKNGVYAAAVKVFPLHKPIYVAVKKQGDRYWCQALFDNPQKTGEYTFYAQGKKYTFPIVYFNGIVHIVADETLGDAAARDVIKDLATEIKAPALGIMIYNSKISNLKPYVYVPDTDTLFLENSCASGSCAVAFLQNSKNLKTDIVQPGGIIGAEKLGGGICLTSEIRIVNTYSEDI